MSDTAPALVVLDMAGTTVAVGGEVAAAFREALAGAGVALDDERIRAIRGLSKREAIAALLREAGRDDGDADAVHAGFRRTLLARYRNAGVRPMPGAAETFAWCRRRDIAVALTTGFDRELAGLLLERLGWEGQVNALVCNDDVARGRPAPDLIFRAMERTGCEQVARVAAVGDTRADLQAGANAGVGWNIAVLSGAHSRDDLAACPHHALLASIAGLPGFFDAGR